VPIKTRLKKQGDLSVKKLHFPEPFIHRHEPVRDVNKLDEERLTFGQKGANFVAKIAGSWSFIIIQSVILVLWAILNVIGWSRHWDPYPFILMNLFLSLQAAYTAPIILMSQNRLVARDRIEAHEDFLLNYRAEEEIRAVLEHLAAQDNALMEIHEILNDMQQNLAGGKTPG
jgi:uncharacterized membrane protein